MYIFTENTEFVLNVLLLEDSRLRRDAFFITSLLRIIEVIHHTLG